METIKLLIETLLKNDLSIRVVPDEKDGIDITIGLKAKTEMHDVAQGTQAITPESPAFVQMIGRGVRSTKEKVEAIYQEIKIDEATPEEINDPGDMVTEAPAPKTRKPRQKKSDVKEVTTVKPEEKLSSIANQSFPEKIIAAEEDARPMNFDREKEAIIVEAERLFKAGDYKEAKVNYESARNLCALRYAVSQSVKLEAEIAVLDKRIAVCQSWINRLNDLYGDTPTLTPQKEEEKKVEPVPVEMPLDLMGDDEDLPL